MEGADRGPGVRGASCCPGQVWGREPPRSAAGVALSSGLEKKPEGAACVTQRQVPGGWVGGRSWRPRGEFTPRCRLIL